MFSYPILRKCGWGFVDKDGGWVECGKDAKVGYGMCAHHLETYDPRKDKQLLELYRRNKK